MTIAVSVVVKPSSLLLTLMVALYAGVMMVALCIALGLVGELAIWPRLLLALVCVILACIGLVRAVYDRKNYHIDISGVGQIRLKEVRLAEVSPNPDGMLVILLADSTLWPWFLVLRLQDEAGRVHALSILRDSLSAQSFRSLAVACRWVAAHRISELN
jgi:toxin CptA